MKQQDCLQCLLFALGLSEKEHNVSPWEPLQAEASPSTLPAGEALREIHIKGWLTHCKPDVDGLQEVPPPGGVQA